MSTGTDSLPMTIGGEAVGGGDTFDVVNPATGQPFAVAPAARREDVAAAVAAAARAFPAWAADEAARRSCLEAAVAVMKANLDQLASTLTAEQGKPRSEARIEVLGARAWLRYFAALELPSEVIQDDDRALVRVIRRPVGATAAITPWNFPLALLCWKLGPALLAGNTVVAKPSPFTPLTSLLFGRLMADVFPPGVLNIVSGGTEAGAWLTASPGVRKISFTGSIATGKLVARAAADDLKRVTLELGGNDAAIVLDDADPAAIADDLFWGAFANCGQVCTAIKRVYVPDALHDELVDALAEIARSVHVGDGADEHTQLGPINNRPQQERVSSLVEEAVAGGARTAAGGAAPDRAGFFFDPTILYDVADGARIVDEEQFGPALPVIRYRDVAGAVEAANATPFALGGSVWGTDLDRARDVATRLDCGTTWINTHSVLQPHQPFGGLKWSGLGVENGPWGVYGFTDLQVLYEARG